MASIVLWKAAEDFVWHGADDLTEARTARGPNLRPRSRSGIGYVDMGLDQQGAMSNRRSTGKPSETVRSVVARVAIPVAGLVLTSDITGAATLRSAAGQSEIRIKVVNGEHAAFELEVRRAPLNQVLDELAAKAGVKLHYSALPKETVTATCAAVSLQALLSCLLGPRADLMFRDSKGLSANEGADVPAEAWILGSSLGQSAPATDDCGQLERSRKDGGKGGDNAVSKRSGRTPPFDHAELLRMAAATDPGQRADAIAMLAGSGKLDEPGAQAAIEAALNDGDAVVRARAVSVYARRGGDAAAAVLQEAMHDQDVDVRMAVVGNAGRDAQSISLLKEALGDSDETVRTLAGERLQAMTQPGTPRY